MESNLLKLAAKMQDNPELQDQIKKEAERLVNGGEAADKKAALTAAIRNLTGLEVSADSLNELGSNLRAVTGEELEAASGGTLEDGNLIIGSPVPVIPNPAQEFADKVKKWWDSLTNWF